MYLIMPSFRVVAHKRTYAKRKSEDEDQQKWTNQATLIATTCTMDPGFQRTWVT